MPELTTPRKRKLAPSPAHWNPILQTSQKVKDIYGETLSFEYNYYFEGEGNRIFPKKEWEELGRKIASKMAYQKGYFENLELRVENAKNVVLYFINSKKNINTKDLHFDELILLANQCKDLFMEYDAASVFAWFAAGDYFKKIVGDQLGLSQDELDIVSMPLEQTFASQMERKVIEASLTDDSVEKLSKELAEKYYWIPFGYDGPVIWDEKYFAAKIKEYKSDDGLNIKLNTIITRDEQIKKEAQEIISKNDFSDDKLRFIHILRSIAVWTDERKWLEYPIFIIYHKVLKEFSLRYDLTVEELKYLLTDELVELDKDNKELKNIATKRINGEFTFKIENGEVKFIDNEEAERVKSAITQDLNVEILNGNIACKGTRPQYRARVKIMKSSHEISKIESGDILVATMTTPEYVPAMNKALGFITDEGGVTCHAAIVAREMNKPCIIGTKIATKVLKDNDLIEIDTNIGVIKILR